MTPATPPQESFESQVLSRLDKIDADLTALSNKVEKQQTELDDMKDALEDMAMRLVFNTFD